MGTLRTVMHNVHTDRNDKAFTFNLSILIKPIWLLVPTLLLLKPAVLFSNSELLEIQEPYEFANWNFSRQICFNII